MINNSSVIDPDPTKISGSASEINCTEDQFMINNSSVIDPDPTKISRSATKINYTEDQFIVNNSAIILLKADFFKNSYI